MLLQGFGEGIQLYVSKLFIILPFTQTVQYLEGLVQYYGNPIANALKLLQSCK